MINGNVGTVTIKTERSLLTEDPHIVISYTTINSEMSGPGDGIRRGDPVVIDGGTLWKGEVEPIGIALDSVGSDEPLAEYPIRVVVFGVVRKEELQKLNPASCTPNIIEGLRQEKVYIV